MKSWKIQMMIHLNTDRLIKSSALISPENVCFFFSLFWWLKWLRFYNNFHHRFIADWLVTYCFSTLYIWQLITIILCVRLQSQQFQHHRGWVTWQFDGGNINSLVLQIWIIHLCSYITMTHAGLELPDRKACFGSDCTGAKRKHLLCNCHMPSSAVQIKLCIEWREQQWFWFCFLHLLWQQSTWLTATLDGMKVNVAMHYFKLQSDVLSNL